MFFVNPGIKDKINGQNLVKGLYCKGLTRFKGFECKKCFYCSSGDVQKYGKVKGKQRYKCNACTKQFLGGERLNNTQLWCEYAYGKQTLSELALRYKCSPKTIQRRLKSYQITLSLPMPKPIVLLIDTTYWKRDSGSGL